MSPDPARPDEPPDPGPPEVPPDPAAPEVPLPPIEVPLPPMFQAGAQVAVVGAPQRGTFRDSRSGSRKGLQRWCPWIQARQGRLVLATGFVEYCGCPVGLLRAAKKPKRLYFLCIILVSSEKKSFRWENVPRMHFRAVSLAARGVWYLPRGL